MSNHESPVLWPVLRIGEPEGVFDMPIWVILAWQKTRSGVPQSSQKCVQSVRQNEGPEMTGIE
jgi:hypothetical protein